MSTFAALLKNRATLNKEFWRGGRVVDCGGLENRCTARYPGFESLSLRNKKSVNQAFARFTLFFMPDGVSLTFLLFMLFMLEYDCFLTGTFGIFYLDYCRFFVPISRDAYRCLFYRLITFVF